MSGLQPSIDPRYMGHRMIGPDVDYDDYGSPEPWDEDLWPGWPKRIDSGTRGGREPDWAMAAPYRPTMRDLERLAAERRRQGTAKRSARRQLERMRREGV